MSSVPTNRTLPEIEKIIFNVRSNGFAKASERVLGDDEVSELEGIIDRLHAAPSNTLDYCSNAPVLVGLANRDPRLDYLLNKILSSDKVSTVLTSILGSGYKIWEISSRVSLPNDPGLELHVDAPGQMNLWLLLNDQTDQAGVTMFWPASHLLPRWAKYISWAHPRICKLIGVVRPLVGRAGEHAFFINKTWHGRLPSNDGRTRKAIGIGFFAEGARYTPCAVDRPMFPTAGTELNKRLSSTEGVKSVGDGRVEVLRSGTKEKDELPFAMEIEVRQPVRSGHQIAQYLLLLAFEIIFRPVRAARKMVQYLSQRLSIS